MVCINTVNENDVAIIIVGLNAHDFVKGCLQSILDAQWLDKSYEVIYVDNGSVDNSCVMVQNEFPQVKLIANDANLGFCKAANQGADGSNSRYYYFINDDTLVVENAISLLVNYMDAHPDVGTTGSRLLYPDMTEQFSGRMFPSVMNALMGRRSLLSRLFPNSASLKKYLCSNQLSADTPFPVDWVSAAGQIVRKSTFEKVGQFAEDYYYWHESVFCHRISQQGQKVMLHPLSKIIHFEGKGSGARPFRSQVFHIKDFNRGAFRCYCELHNLKWFHFSFWMSGCGLLFRALILLGLATIKIPFKRA